MAGDKRFVLHYVLAGFVALLGACSSNGGTGSPTGTGTPSSSSAPGASTPVNYNTQEYQDSEVLARVDALAAYDAGGSGNGVLISVIDTGIDTDNPEFTGRIDSRSADLVQAGIVLPSEVRPGGPNLNDVEGHGTSVASILAAARNNIGVHGIAPEADLLVYRTSDEADPLLILGSALNEAVTRTASIGADVLNLSLGSDEAGSRAEFRGYFDLTSAADIVSVVAAGNDSLTSPEQSALAALDPEARDTVIIAGALSSGTALAFFSNQAGIAASKYLVAPGSLVPTVALDQPAGTIAYFSGTSAATPLIAGAAAVLRQLWPSLTAAEVVEILLDSATDLGDPGTDPVYGRGMLNLEAALAPAGAASTSSVSGVNVSVSSLVPAFTSSAAFGGLVPDFGSFTFIDSYGRDYSHALGGNTPTGFQMGVDPIAVIQPHRKTVTGTTALGRGIMHLQMRHTDLSFEDQYAALRATDYPGGFADGFTATHADSDYQLNFTFTHPLGIGHAMTIARGFSARELERTAMLDVLPFSLSRDGADDGYLSRGEGSMSALTQSRLGKSLRAALLYSHNPDADESNIKLRLVRSAAFGSVQMHAGMKAENNSILGAQLNTLMGASANARSFYAGMAARGHVIGNIYVDALYQTGLTTVSGLDGFVTSITGLRSEQYSIGVSAVGLINADDHLRLSLSAPLQVVDGMLHLAVPDIYFNQSQQFGFDQRAVSLSPERYQRDVELAYFAPGPWGSVLEANLIHQSHQGIGVTPGMAAVLRASTNF